MEPRLKKEVTVEPSVDCTVGRVHFCENKPKSLPYVFVCAYGCNDNPLTKISFKA